MGLRPKKKLNSLLNHAVYHNLSMKQTQLL